VENSGTRSRLINWRAFDDEPFCTMPLHLDWVVFQLHVANIFNSMSKGVIFQELRVVGGNIIQFIPFVYAFYAFESPLFYNHHNHEDNITIVILSIMGTRQGGPLGGALFVLAHFRALCFIINHFFSYVFPSIVDDTHIIGPPSIISSPYEHFQTELCAIDLSIQPQKCVMWSPSNLLLDFNTPSQFTTPSKGIRVLGVPFNTSLFTSSFIKDALLDDV
jgi:hypothetical protein